MEKKCETKQHKNSTVKSLPVQNNWFLMVDNQLLQFLLNDNLLFSKENVLFSDFKGVLDNPRSNTWYIWSWCFNWSLQAPSVKFSILAGWSY